MQNVDYKSIIQSGKAMLLVSGEGCANCVTMLPAVNKVSAKYPDVAVGVIEIDGGSAEFLQEYEIEKVPTVVLFKNGEVVAKVSGYQPDEIFEIYVADKLGL